MPLFHAKQGQRDRVLSPWVAAWDKRLRNPKWNENQNLLILKIQGLDFLMQGFDFEIQGICSYINGNAKFWQSFDFGLEKKSKPKQNVNF